MLLTAMRGLELGVGDVVRLSENYDIGPGSEPVDLMVFDPRDDQYGLGLMVISGYKAGLTFCIFPSASFGPQRGLSVDWLLSHWSDWFRFTYVDRSVPYADTTVIGWQNRRLVSDDSDLEERSALERARDRLIRPTTSEMSSLLSLPPGEFVELTEIVKDFEPGRERILVSWQPYRDPDYELMLLYFDAGSFKSLVSAHTEHWKSNPRPSSL